MARKPALKHIKNELQKRLYSSANLYTAVIKFTSQDTWEAIQGYGPLHPGQAKRIIALAFLDMISQWEVFVENCFIRFIAGASYLDGTLPPVRIKNCTSIKHAFQLASLKGKYDPTVSYLSFNSWQQVEEKAKIFFLNGEPFTSLTDLEKQRLRDAIIIRNRVAHYSAKCRSQFNSLAKEFLNVNKLWSGFSVGDLLITETTNHFGCNKQQTVFFHYYDLIHKMSGRITK